MSAPLPSVLLLKPLHVEKPWGCEDWLAADLPEGQSTVAAGPFQNMTLGELVKRFGSRITGHSVEYSGRMVEHPTAFPLLIKIIEANDDLSVQVHPGPDDLAQYPEQLAGACSKDESWYLLDAQPDAAVYHGLQNNITADDLRRVLAADLPDDVRSSEVAQLLRRVPVQRGDVLHVTPGTVHAILRGTRIVEVQQPSDTTYRLWDYARRDSKGALRPLHVEEALRVTKNHHAPALITPHNLYSDEHVLIRQQVSTPYYDMATLHADIGTRIEWPIDGNTPFVVVALTDGIHVGDGTTGYTLTQGQAALIPAGTATGHNSHVAVDALRDGASCLVASLGGGSQALAHATSTRRRHLLHTPHLSVA